MPRWVFVRHGQSVANEQGWFSGHTDVELTPLGEEQARQVGAVLRQRHVDRAVVSDLRRAVRTAQLILGARSVPVLHTEALRERHTGEWTGRTLQELEPLGWREVFYGWNTRPPGGESLTEVARRATSFLAELPEASSTLVVAHGGVLRALLGLLDDDDPAGPGRRGVDNAHPLEREVAPGRWRELAGRLGGIPR